ncbi:HTH-type transcriptional activator CmpR [BD1-7 clade bacterium]|uniref:HTH-type transcriptional activator CmpR n=1 Tax=BD1-7 clade bacterium TaxID=2029982 RepID=A0A5S9NUF2_9GAMM|nr:HTH-type transcriptional activator CmpR [BD1-7 clade bacterium]
METARWDDYRIAYQVARSGSLAKAGAALGINHSTVLRRIDQLEAAIGTALFIRHQRGYQLTDAGHVFVDNMPQVIEAFASLENRLVAADSDLRGKLVITTPSDYLVILNPYLKRFRDQYPLLRLEIFATDEKLSLAAGDAHVAIRLGPKPDEADLIVKALTEDQLQYCASESYIERYGELTRLEDCNDHLWVMPNGRKTRLPMIRSVLDHLDPERVVYQTNGFLEVYGAVEEGMGIGPVPRLHALRSPRIKVLNLKLDQPKGKAWFVYHRDVKHNVRVKALYQFLANTLP